jgi:phosphoserine phosphatase
MGLEFNITTSRPTTIYLARHGETEYNRLRVMQGRRINAGLNVSGRNQAEALAERFSQVPLDAVYSSTLWRAIQTAGAVSRAQASARTVRCVPAFDEMSWGRFEGMPPCDELDRMLETTFAQWDRGDFVTPVEGGESIVEVQSRAVEGLARLVRRHEGERILLVAHGRLIRVLLASILPEYGLPRMQEIEHGNTSVNELLFDREGCRARSMNCVRHLEALAA